jgi:hypothetical protein
MGTRRLALVFEAGAAVSESDTMSEAFCLELRIAKAAEFDQPNVSAPRP